MRLLLLLALPALLLAQLRVGRATVDITPPEKMPMAGYYYIRLNEGTLDPLYAKAIALETGGTRTVLMAVDYVQIPQRFVEEARTRIAARTGVAPENVMISATHSHTGPELGSRLRNVDAATDRLAHDFWGRIPALLAEAAARAVADLRPARASVAVGEEGSISFIRRFRMIDGTTGWNPGKRNPKIVEPRGRIDPAVPVVTFTGEDGKPLAAYVNFALHLDVVGGAKFSSDYAGVLSRLLREARDPEFVTVFTIGAAGNINHIDVSHNRPQKGPAEAARIGTVLAGAVLRAAEHAAPVPPGERLGVSRVKLALAPAPYPEADIAKAKAVVANYGQPNANPFYEQVQAFKVLDLEEKKGQPVEAEVQVLALGQTVAWVGLPGEIFVELGRQIKNASPFPVTIVTALANANVGYVPDRKAYAEGAYEVISSRLAAGGGEAMAVSAIDQLIRLYHATPGGATK